MSQRALLYSELGLRQEDVENWADGDLELAEALYGVPLFLYEMITGAGADGFPPQSPPNPQGRTGLDHSGPPYGCAMRHPIAVWGGAIVADLAAYDAEGEGEQYVEAGSLERHFGGGVWNRPFHGHEGAPYSRGYWSIVAHRSSGSGAVTVTCRTQGAGGEIRSTDITVSSTTPVVFDLDADGSASEFFADLAPGDTSAWLKVSADDSTPIQICAVTLNQVAKRRH